MYKNKELVIPFKGLSIGFHNYNFVINNSFFEDFEFTDIKRGSLNLSLSLEKESNLMRFDFHFTGNVWLNCDRCLEMYEQPLEGDFQLIVKYGELFREISDDMIELPFTESRLDLGQYVYEYINLLLPIKHVHPDDENGISTCNPEMLKKLEETASPKVDPRWEELKKLKK